MAVIAFPPALGPHHLANTFSPISSKLTCILDSISPPHATLSKKIAFLSRIRHKPRSRWPTQRK